MRDRQLEMIVFYANQLGCATKVQQSDSGAGVFIEIPAERQDFKTNPQTESCVIRLSTQPLPNDFRVLKDIIDYEVGSHKEANGSWFDCVVLIAQRFELPLPAMIKGL